MLSIFLEVAGIEVEIPSVTVLVLLSVPLSGVSAAGIEEEISPATVLVPLSGVSVIATIGLPYI